MSLTVGSLFSGIGGMDLACERAEMSVTWQCEIDKQCRDVLRHHWPKMRIYDDVRSLSYRTPAVDVMVGGFPCQDLSVAGNRAGLAGERSGLWWQFRRLVAELAPRWVLIENVPGLLSSNGGRDMGTVLGSLGQLGYWWSYRVLDAQWFGVPQRRRRVFIVGHLGDRSAPATVLFEPESVCRDHPPRIQTREDVAKSLRASSGSRGTDDSDRMTFVPFTNRGYESDGSTDRLRAASHGALPMVAQALSTREHERLTRGGEPVNLIAHTLRAEGHDASEDGTGRGTPLVTIPLLEVGARTNGDGYRDGDGIGAPGDPMYTLQASKQHGIATGLAVRRLTPLECSRLQGFPDSWLDIPGLSDSAKYRMLGNSVAVPVVEWITRRMAALE